eukprot:10386476-Alexandrium_andersonii.AAC.1
MACKSRCRVCRLRAESVPTLPHCAGKKLTSSGKNKVRGWVMACCGWATACPCHVRARGVQGACAQ